MSLVAPKSERARRIVRLFGDFGGAGFAFFSGQIGVVLSLIAFGFSIKSASSAPPLSVLSAYIIGGVTTLLALSAVATLYGYNLRALINFNRPRLTDVGYATVGFGFYFLLAIIVMLGVKAAFPELNVNQEQDLGITRNLESLELLFAFVAFTILPPISEEILFRGFLYKRLRHARIPAVVSAIITSLLFGIVHAQVNVAIDTFVLSMVIIYTMSLREYNIWIAIIIHFLKNLFAFLGLFVFKASIG